MTVVPKRPLKPAVRIKKRKKKDVQTSDKVQDSAKDGRIILICPKPNKFRRAVRRELIKSIKVYEASKTSNIAIVGHRPHIAPFDEFQQRRRILCALIVDRRKFFLSEIEGDFAKITGGKRCTDGFTSVRKFVDNLVEVGVLEKKMDRYYFSPRTSSRR